MVCRKLRIYEFTCDQWLPDVTECEAKIVVHAEDKYFACREAREEHGWSQSAEYWFCPAHTERAQ